MRHGSKDFMEQQPFVVTADDLQKRWGGIFGCALCGKDFKEGDIARWIFSNYAESPIHGNPFIHDAAAYDNHAVLQELKTRRDKIRSRKYRWVMRHRN